MKNVIYLIIISVAGLLVGCSASLPPQELLNARLAYQHASDGPAAQLVPAELHKAHTALSVAEKSFQDDPDSYHTRDLAYVADRKAKMAEALASIAVEKAATAKATNDYQLTQTEIVKNKTEQLAIKQKALVDADKRAADALADLAKLAAVKEETRGLVITLSGSVLFASNKFTLLPSAQERLNKVADALLTNKERKLTVEGYTDSQGSSSYNQTLSQKRADEVRSYLVSRGYSGELIQAEGFGEDSPVASNDNANGRADNRRVEIVVSNAVSQ